MTTSLYEIVYFLFISFFLLFALRQGDDACCAGIFGWGRLIEAGRERCLIIIIFFLWYELKSQNATNSVLDHCSPARPRAVRPPRV